MNLNFDYHQTSWLFQNPWVIVLLPFVSAVFIALIMRKVSEYWSGIVATLSVSLSSVLSLILCNEYLFHKSDHFQNALVPWQIEWLVFQPGLSVNIGTIIDPLSILMLVVVTFVSALVHIFSLGYMKGEDGYGRYFASLNFFTFSMLGLVVSSSIFQMFIFWELVGLSSFLLIGFYFSRPSAVSAAKKAFIVTRFADLGFLIGIIILAYFGITHFSELADSFKDYHSISKQISAFDFLFLNHSHTLQILRAHAPEILGISVITFAALLIFIGAAGKSAMFPLHIWLPDAMEGPTPVSALIHAATMVVAGVYLIARMFPLFVSDPIALDVITSIGVFTSIFAAIIACTQDDIKRVLAFSTLSQIGYMMFALGVSSISNTLGYEASLFHLFTHAFFKALLFLCAGSIIHAVHTNNIQQMGGLLKKMPITHICFLIGILALAGIPPFAGFFSKDEILLAAYETDHWLVFGLALLASGFTAFYMFRVYWIVFWQKEKSEHIHHAHESPYIMLLPLIVLAALSSVAGFFPVTDFVSFINKESTHSIHPAIALPATGLAITGVFFSYLFYMRKTDFPLILSNKFSIFYSIIKNKFYIDEIYLFVTKQIIFRMVSAPIAWFDRNVVDGSVNASGFITRQSGKYLAKLQTGQAQDYLTWLIVGSVSLLLLLWMIIS